MAKSSGGKKGRKIGRQHRNDAGGTKQRARTAANKARRRRPGDRIRGWKKIAS